jgi:NodT family efflux transporter outer membrane factor (OMF) lipoprotein
MFRLIINGRPRDPRAAGTGPLGWAGAIAMSLALCACITPPKLEAPLPTITQDELGLAPQGSVPVAAKAWWSAFDDAQLDRLMQKALADNPSLAQALARVREAQSVADVTRAGLGPAVSFDAQEVRRRLSGYDPIPKPYPGTTQWQGLEGLNFSWDLDFWGRQAALLKQASSQTTAAIFDVDSARLALSGAVARAYIDLYRNDALLEVAQRTEAQRQRILEITRRRVQSGLDTNVELREASGAVPEAHVELLQAEVAAELDKHQLASLSGQGAELYAQLRPPTFDPGAVLVLPSALPADLLGRRPDVLAARERIESAHAGLSAAKAAFYPDINLAAFAGTSAIGVFSNLFQGAATAYQVGPAIHLPLFDAGRLRAKYRGSAAQIDDAVAAYNQSVLEAVRETSDQLSQVGALAVQIEEQQRSLDDAEVAYRLAEERYQSGVSSYLTVLNTETAVLIARREHVELVSGQALARVTLLLAVGGSFDPQVP